ncbi:mycofactocin-associated electron transfer flavoprotein alpha subunit [Lipingzhangella sp. LS1_29]|uniref:Mycofactocin-associated electron transfer flavoprotein alpha subunit n=1 Tax=Lipingzhangella rawalii TaxID=2055835 RepID=A0ABU2H6K6_9ACTN|nr:mycofactocin-associated electron transfer flavoprotein alpha subunit [Lipingzhangella rawalii]MDS1270925.1 mycofactocin-associated electron transfer flavoprotein alpha subunit [Lipingzhangella rawalii]
MTTSDPSALHGAVAVVPVRAGVLPSGAEEVVAEAGGYACVVGGGAEEAAHALHGAVTISWWDTPGFRPGTWAGVLAGACARFGQVLLPASADGRDLAPRIAARMGRPLLAEAIELGGDFVVLPRDGDRRTERVQLTGPAVLTIRPGTGGRAISRLPPRSITELELGTRTPHGHDAQTLEVTYPAPQSIDLAEARRVVTAGAGLLQPTQQARDDAAELVATMTRVAAALHAAVGGTRVVTDAEYLPESRQIGSAGVMVAPDLYVALGVSGATHHLAGTGDPRHLVAVNTDPSCPMMAAADLALVADAPAVLAALARHLGVADPEPDVSPRGDQP